METETETQNEFEAIETRFVDAPDVLTRTEVQFEVEMIESEPREPVIPAMKGIRMTAKIVVTKDDQCVDHYVKNASLDYRGSGDTTYLCSLGITESQAKCCLTMMTYCANIFEVARQLGGEVEGIHFESHD